MSPRDTGSAAPSPQLDAPASAFDPATILQQQQRAFQALAASGQAFLAGLQEVARRSALVQTALLQQTLAGFASVSSAARTPDGGDDASARAMAAADATVASVRDVMEAACKCHTDALAAFQQHMAGQPEAPACIAHSPQGRG